MVKKHFLEDLVKDAGEPGFRNEAWYNADGDCFVYKSAPVAVVAERVDDVLTIYESAEDGRAIGFKIKGVQHILSSMGCHALAIGAAKDETGQIISVAMILIQALLQTTNKATIATREGYARALEAAAPPLLAKPIADIISA